MSIPTSQNLGILKIPAKFVWRGIVIIRNFSIAFTFFLYNGFLTHIPVYWIRHFYLGSILRIRLAKGVSVHSGCHFTGGNVSIGSGTVINRNCYVDGRVGIEIGDQVSISPECYLLSLTHDPQSPTFEAVSKPLNIGSRAWLGARAIILPGAHVGEGAVVGAGAVVTKPTGEYTIVAGNPARKIGDRRKDLQYRLYYFPLFNTDIQA